MGIRAQGNIVEGWERNIYWGCECRCWLHAVPERDEEENIIGWNAMITCQIDPFQNSLKYCTLLFYNNVHHQQKHVIGLNFKWIRFKFNAWVRDGSSSVTCQLCSASKLQLCNCVQVCATVCKLCNCATACNCVQLCNCASVCNYAIVQVCTTVQLCNCVQVCATVQLCNFVQVCAIMQNTTNDPPASGYCSAMAPNCTRA